MGVTAIARKPLKLGSTEISVGKEFDPADYGNRNWTNMMRRGDIDYVYREDEAPVAPAEGKEEGAASDEVAPSPYLSMTRAQLVEVLAEMGIAEEDVEGTGSNGYATVEDLRELVLREKAED